MNNKSFFVVILQLIQSVLTALTVIFLANLLPTKDYGRYVSSITFASVLPLFAGLGGEHVFLMQASKRSKLIPVLFGNAFFLRGILTILCIIVASAILFLAKIPHAYALLFVISGALLSVFANPFFLSFYRVKGLHVRPWVMCFFCPFLFIVYLFFLPKNNLTFEGVSFGYLLSNFITFVMFLIDMNSRLRLQFSWRYTKKYFRTGIMFSISQAFDYAFARMDIFLIQLVLGTYAVALYAAGQKIVSLLQLIPSSFHIVELPEFHRVSAMRNQLVEKFRNLRRTMFELSFLSFGLLILNAQFIVDLLYKDQYKDSYHVVIILSLANIIFFVNYPYYMLAEAINKIKERMYMRIAAFICTIFFLWLLLTIYGVNGAAIGLLLGQCLFFILLHVLAKDYNAGLSGLLSDGRMIIIALFAIVVAYLTGMIFNFGVVRFFISSIVYGLIYILLGAKIGFLDISYLAVLFEKIVPLNLKNNPKIHYADQESNGTPLATAFIVKNSKRDIIFLITGKPLPAMLDMARVAKNEGLNTLMVILERGEEDLTIDFSLVNFDIITIDVKYKSVDLKRLSSIPSTYKQLKKIISDELNDNGILVTSSYDLLLFGRLIASGKNYVIRHQVRDLHALQLSKTLISSFFVFIEKMLLSSVESIIVSSPEFVNQYYKRIFEGKWILLENTPSKSTWADFKKRSYNDNSFVIGFVGIIRYKPSLFQLIDAVHALNSEGFNIKVIFAGGGHVDDLKERITQPKHFEFQGSYEYTKDIKRLYCNLDLIYAVYDSYDLNCQLAMPNKFYEAIISKIPIIVASNTFVGREVNRTGIGTSVLSGDKEELIEKLRVAVNNSGWYRSAIENLASCSAEPYYMAYDKAMLESIMPSDGNKITSI